MYCKKCGREKELMIERLIAEMFLPKGETEYRHIRVIGCPECGIQDRTDKKISKEEFTDKIKSNRLIYK
jgi:hypothetical protein